LHGAIALDSSDAVEALLIQLIDTAAFQRLRRIRQLGPASLTFHGAESSRFTHSVGVMAIARRAFDRLAERYPQLAPYRASVLCAALLHDIGHGPFSHTCEDIFGSHHEHWTLRILKEAPPVRSLLDTYDSSLLPQIEQIYQKQHPIPLVWQLVSSQLDCDRLDYLMRDSYFTGTSYGKLDLDRIILALDYDLVSQQLVVARKGMAAIEHYLVVRYFMYAQVYNHPKNIAASWVLEKCFKRAKECLHEGRLQADETVTAWLQQDCNQLPLQNYLAADDGVFFYHLQRWQHQEDNLLADLCRRFVNRDLFKAADISHLSSERQQGVMQRMQHELSQMTEFATGPHFYVGLRTVFTRGYTLYHRGIKLKESGSLQEISDISPLVKTLANPWQRTWLIYPGEVEHKVVELIATPDSPQM
jgi:HD superfamily phosphohydrolase